MRNTSLTQITDRELFKGLPYLLGRQHMRHLRSTFQPFDLACRQDRVSFLRHCNSILVGMESVHRHRPRDIESLHCTVCSFPRYPVPGPDCTSLPGRVVGAVTLQGNSTQGDTLCLPSSISTTGRHTRPRALSQEPLSTLYTRKTSP